MRGRVLLLAAALFVLLLTAGGCGGGEASEPLSPSPQASFERFTTYTNEEWGFSLDYPAEWIERELAAFGSGDRAIAFGEPELEEELEEGDWVGAVREGAAWVCVGTLRGPDEIAESDVSCFLEQWRSNVRGSSSEIAELAENVQTWTGFLAGVPCLFVEASVKPDGLFGLMMHQRLHYIVKGDVLYILQLDCAESVWPEKEAQLEAIAESFVLL
ncbi:MAG: hypothetical protein JW767_04005 [Thermoleophilia bacterium]|nr:hypothetical protein [Thermoleophilia bacterium]